MDKTANGHMTGRELRRARFLLEFNQGQLAEVLGVTPQQISYWEGGHRRIPPGRANFVRHLVRTSGARRLRHDGRHGPSCDDCSTKWHRRQGALAWLNASGARRRKRIRSAAEARKASREGGNTR